jgi:hypothetical protein
LSSGPDESDLREVLPVQASQRVSLRSRLMILAVVTGIAGRPLVNSIVNEAEAAPLTLQQQNPEIPVVNPDNLDLTLAALASEGVNKVLIEFSTTSCLPCKVVAKHYPEIDTPETALILVDADDARYYDHGSHSDEAKAFAKRLGLAQLPIRVPQFLVAELKSDGTWSFESVATPGSFKTDDIWGAYGPILKKALHD